MEVDNEAAACRTRVLVPQEDAVYKRIKVHYQPKRGISPEIFISKRLRTQVDLEEHINDCASLDELSALYQSCEEFRSAFEHLFFDRKQVLQYEQQARVAMQSELWLEAKAACLDSLRQYGFDFRTFALLCKCLIKLKSSTQVVEYFQKLHDISTQKEQGVLYPLLCVALLRTGKNLDVVFKIGDEESIAKANKLQQILQSSVFTAGLVKQGLEISPECVELQQLELLYCFPASDEFRALQPLGANEFGLRLFDRLDFHQAAVFISATSSQESELITKLQRVKTNNNNPKEPELVEFESLYLQRLFAARPRFHSNWLMWRATIANTTKVLDLLQRAVKADSTNQQARSALATELEKQAPPPPPPPPASNQTLYQVLGLTQNSTLAEIRKAYKKLALQYHPDKNPTHGGSVQFDRISRAHEVLTDQEQRQVYNLTLYKI